MLARSIEKNETETSASESAGRPGVPEETHSTDCIQTHECGSLVCLLPHALWDTPRRRASWVWNPQNFSVAPWVKDCPELLPAPGSGWNAYTQGYNARLIRYELL